MNRVAYCISMSLAIPNRKNAHACGVKILMRRPDGNMPARGRGRYPRPPGRDASWPKPSGVGGCPSTPAAPSPPMVNLLPAPTANTLGFRRKSPALYIGKSQPEVTQRLTRIRSSSFWLLDYMELVPVDPAGKHHKQELANGRKLKHERIIETIWPQLFDLHLKLTQPTLDLAFNIDPRNNFIFEALVANRSHEKS